VGIQRGSERAFYEFICAQFWMSPRSYVCLCRHGITSAGTASPSSLQEAAQVTRGKRSKGAEGQAHLHALILRHRYSSSHERADDQLRDLTLSIHLPKALRARVRALSIISRSFESRWCRIGGSWELTRISASSVARVPRSLACSHLSLAVVTSCSSGNGRIPPPSTCSRGRRPISDNPILAHPGRTRFLVHSSCTLIFSLTKGRADCSANVIDHQLTNRSERVISSYLCVCCRSPRNSFWSFSRPP